MDQPYILAAETTNFLVPNATFLVQKAEMKNAAWPEPGTATPGVVIGVVCQVQLAPPSVVLTTCA